MRVLITGVSGQLGSAIMEMQSQYSSLELIGKTSKELNIDNAEQVSDAFRSGHYDYCINSAAYTAVDQAESNQEDCLKVNVTGVGNLAKACEETNTFLIHISTDFVFDGLSNRPLKESDLTDPVNFYGATKLKGEQAIQSHLSNYLIVRTSWLFRETGHNFLNTMIGLSQKHEELKVVNDQLGTPTYAGDLASAVLKIISERNHQTGIYHYSNEGTATWYDFAKAIFEYMHQEIVVKPVNSDMFPTPAKRPNYSVMDKTRIKNDFDLTIPYWRESLKKCIKKR